MELPEFAMIVAKEDAALPVHDDAILFCNRRSAGISELGVSPLFKLATPTLPGGSVELPMARDIIRAAHDGMSAGAASVCKSCRRSVCLGKLQAQRLFSKAAGAALV